MIINNKMSIVGSLNTTPLGLMAHVLSLKIVSQKRKKKKTQKVDLPKSAVKLPPIFLS